MLEVVASRITSRKSTIVAVKEQLKLLRSQRQQVLFLAKCSFVEDSGTEMENNMFGQLLDTIRCKSQNMEVDQLTACVNEYFRVIKGMSTIIPPNEEDIIVATTLENEQPSQVDNVNLVLKAQRQLPSASKRLSDQNALIAQKDSEMQLLCKQTEVLNELQKEIRSVEVKKEYKSSGVY